MSSTTPTTDTETILRRIRGLLDQAERTPFPEEAEAFAAKAADLMARHHVDRAMLERSAPGRSAIVELDIDLGRGQYVRARLMLLGVVADAFGCRLLSSSTRSGRVGHVIGHQADTEAVSLLYTSLLIQATRAAQLEPGPRGHRQVTFRRGFLMGFAQRVGDRLQDQMAEAVRHTEPHATPATASVALVLADRQHAVDRWIDDRYPSLRRLAPATPVSVEGVDRGSIAGERADLGSRTVAPARRTLPR